MYSQTDTDALLTYPYTISRCACVCCFYLVHVMYNLVCRKGIGGSRQEGEDDAITLYTHTHALQQRKEPSRSRQNRKDNANYIAHIHIHITTEEGAVESWQEGEDGGNYTINIYIITEERAGRSRQEGEDGVSFSAF